MALSRMPRRVAYLPFGRNCGLPRAFQFPRYAARGRSSSARGRRFREDNQRQSPREDLLQFTAKKKKRRGERGGDGEADRRSERTSSVLAPPHHGEGLVL